MRIPAKVSTSTKPYADLTARDLLDGIKGGSAHDAFSLAHRVEVVLAQHAPENAKLGLPPSAAPRCGSCRELWPCPTVRILNGEGVRAQREEGR